MVGKFEIFSFSFDCHFHSTKHFPSWMVIDLSVCTIRGRYVSGTRGGHGNGMAMTVCWVEMKMYARIHSLRIFLCIWKESKRKCLKGKIWLPPKVISSEGWQDCVCKRSVVMWLELEAAILLVLLLLLDGKIWNIHWGCTQSLFNIFIRKYPRTVRFTLPLRICTSYRRNTQYMYRFTEIERVRNSKCLCFNGWRLWISENGKI